MKRFIIFLIRKRLGLKKNELFRFSNQCEQSVYYFTDAALMKIKYGYVDKSGVSLNWLLDDECKTSINHNFCDKVQKKKGETYE